MSAYRVADDPRELELPWMGRVNPAFERARRRSTYRAVTSVVGVLGSLVGIVLLAWLVNPLAVLGFLLFAVVLKVLEVRNKLHDPTEAVRRHRSEDLVAWAEAVAEREGDRVVGSAFANMLFGLAAEREGGVQSALELYSEAARDVSRLFREPAINAVATVVCVRGAMLAARQENLAVARELISVLDQFRTKEPTRVLRYLPDFDPAGIAGELTSNLPKLEAFARRIAAGEERLERPIDEPAPPPAAIEEGVHFAEDSLSTKLKGST